MKIGFDFHDVLDKHELFRVLANFLVDSGHEVHILTGEERNSALQKKIKDLGIKWTKIFSITSYHKKKGTPIRYDKNGKPWMNKKLWDRTKADYCKTHKIDLHIDNSVTYGKYFKTPYLLVQGYTDSSLSFWLNFPLCYGTLHRPNNLMLIIEKLSKKGKL
jgi:hypothetical protein